VNLKKVSILLILSAIYLFSCKQKNRENNKTIVHFYTVFDTVFLFPEEFRKKNYRDDSFEEISKWLNHFDETKLFDSSKYVKFIRLIYGRAFDNSILIRIERNKVVLKVDDISKMTFNKHFDSAVLSESERAWLRAYPYYKWLVKFHNKDSSKTIAQLISIFPDIGDGDKMVYLRYKRGEVFDEDSIVYKEKIKTIRNSVINKLFKKIDSIGFWSLQHVYYESAMDGSGFLLEARNGDKYNSVVCNNCEVKDLIAIRNEILKFTTLKEDEIY